MICTDLGLAVQLKNEVGKCRKALKKNWNYSDLEVKGEIRKLFSIEREVFLEGNFQR